MTNFDLFLRAFHRRIFNLNVRAHLFPISFGIEGFSRRLRMVILWNPTGWSPPIGIPSLSSAGTMAVPEWGSLQVLAPAPLLEPREKCPAKLRFPNQLDFFPGKLIQNLPRLRCSFQQRNGRPHSAALFFRSIQRVTQ